MWLKVRWSCWLITGREFQNSTNKKLSCCCDSRSYGVRRTVYWRTIKPVSVTSLLTAGTRDPIKRAEFMNAPKLHLLKRDHWSQWITERNTTSARLIACLSLKLIAFSATRFFGAFCGWTLHIRPTAKVFEGTNTNLPARNTLLQRLACTPTLIPAIHSVTDRRTDGRNDDANSRSYCVAVRSANNNYF